jgi:thiamine-monophosphate kinase
VANVAFKRVRDPLQFALHGGDDYELLFAVPPPKVSRLPKVFQGVRLTAIGKFTRERQLLVLNENGTATQLMPRGWDPFRKNL